MRLFVTHPMPARRPPGEERFRRGCGSRPLFPRAFRAMQMRPASLEGHCPTGKHPGLIGMSGAMARGNRGRLPQLLLKRSSPGGLLAEMG